MSRDIAVFGASFPVLVIAAATLVVRAFRARPSPSMIATRLEVGLACSRVFAPPIALDDVTVVPAAVVFGGGGGGESRDTSGSSGEGGGFGLAAFPVGVYVLKDGRVRWVPVIDINLALLVTGSIAMSMIRCRRKR